MERRAAVSADPINPELVFHELSPRLPDDAMITADSGSGTNWYARHVRLRAQMRGSLSGTLATMGCAVPYAIGAKYAHPDRPAYALVGDGAMQMNGINELITIGKYWQDWADPRLVVAVLQNNDLNQVTWELRGMGGSPPVPALPTAARLPLRRLCPQSRAGRHPGGEARAGGERVGRGDGCRPPMRRAVHDRPSRSPHPAPRHMGTDGESARVHRPRRLRPGRCHQGRRQSEDPGLPSQGASGS